MKITHPNTLKFRSLVKEYDLTLQETADMCKRSYQRVKDLHSGKYHTPTAEFLELLEFRLKDSRRKGMNDL